MNFPVLTVGFLKKAKLQFLFKKKKKKRKEISKIKYFFFIFHFCLNDQNPNWLKTQILFSVVFTAKSKMSLPQIYLKKISRTKNFEL